MGSPRTWVWIVGGVLGGCLLVLIVLAVSGAYFVSRHIHSETSTSVDAIRVFEARRNSFTDQRPLFELDESDHPRLARSPSDVPTAATSPNELFVLAWNPEEQRLVKLSLPFWVLSLPRSRVKISGMEPGLNLERFNLDVEELRRIGPAIVLDFRNHEGARVLIWTQ